METLQKVSVTYEELFELLDLGSKTYNETLNPKENIYVDTPSGLKKINAGVIKPSLDMMNIKFNNGVECNVANKHIFSCNGEEKFAEDIEYVDTKTGSLEVSSKSNIGKHDGYDINIDYPHWYYSADDIIYHNSLLMSDIVSGTLKKGKNVLLVSMEMEDKEIMKRVHANVLDLPINKLHEISPDVIRLAHEKTQKTAGKFFVKDYPNGSFSPLMLDALIDNYKIEKGIEFDLIFLDYLGIMKSDLISPNAGLYSYVKSIVEETRSIAKQHKIPIISASQLNRCLSPNTLIKGVDNDIVLKNIKQGDILKSSEGDVTVSDIHKSEKQKTYRIKTKSGKEIICSGEHKFPTNIGTMTVNVGLETGQYVNIHK